MNNPGYRLLTDDASRKEQFLTRDNVTESGHIASRLFSLGNRPRYGNRVERTQDKEAYMELAREDPYCTFHRQHKQRRGEEITNSPNAGS